MTGDNSSKSSRVAEVGMAMALTSFNSEPKTRQPTSRSLKEGHGYQFQRGTCQSLEEGSDAFGTGSFGAGIFWRLSSLMNEIHFHNLDLSHVPIRRLAGWWM